MRWVLILLGAALALVVVGWIISAVKWLLILGAAFVLVGVVVGWRPGQRTSKY